jgi:CheY-like chemotaxis protein
MIDDGRPVGQTDDMVKKTVLVCDGDELARRALARTAIEHGLELTGEAATAVQALQILRHKPTDVVVIANELQGLSGIEVTPELVETGYQVIVVAADGWDLDQAREVGAFAAIRRGDLQAFAQAISGLGTEATPGERRSGTDRRATTDRRAAQDWSKVIRQRRVSDRRVDDRRVVQSAGDEPVEPIGLVARANS